MPSPQDALNYAKRMVGNMPIDDANLIYRVLDDAHKKLWMASRWHWTVAPLEVVTLANGTQDYPVTDPGDVLCLVASSIVPPEGDKYDLSVSACLPATNIIVGRPSQVMLVPAPLRLRFLPVPAGYPSPYPRVVTIYKKKATAIGVASIGLDYETSFGIPAEWFWVFQEIVLLKAYQFANSPKTGTVAVDAQGRAQFTGQYGAVEAAIAEMRRAEEKLYTTIGQEVQNG